MVRSIPGLTETFYGYVETTGDALLLFQGVLDGILQPCPRRLTKEEAVTSIRSGSCFVYASGNETGIKRWTDGMLWSPSRVNGEFLVYRELDVKIPSSQLRLPQMARQAKEMIETEGERVATTTKGTFLIKDNGLKKKTMSVHIGNVDWHLVSYYVKSDVDYGR
ncbi:hypothetical protein SeMB42_g03373 [Synchytrium endobioticum]|nr:hypothetical protein SeMB42_g03375 [Synchytrium endobioticum]TPX47296.1 hypothetical protein SeMB42_g03373 [Synchytrium endobioticum]